MNTRPTWIKVIQKLRKEPSTVRELMGEKIPRSSAYRILKVLEGEGLVKKRGRKYIWHKHLKESFDSSEEYQRALDHSRKLFEVFRSDYGFPPTGLRFEEEERLDCFKKHLRGYPEIYDKWKEFEKNEEEIEKLRDEARKKIKERIETEIDVFNPDALASRIIFGAVRLAMGKRSVNHSEYDIKDDGLFLGAERIGSKESAHDILKYIENACRSKIDLGKKISNLRDKDSSLRLELGKKVAHLRNLAINGTPLHGTCDLCPEVLIKQKGGEKKG